MANDDNRIVIVARLDTSKQAALKIEADLSKISDQVNKDQGFKVIANIDLGKTTQRINSQLATISKNLNLNIGNVQVNTSGIQQSMNATANAAKNATSQVNQLSQSLANLDDKYTQSIGLKTYIDKTGDEYTDALANIRALRDQLKDFKDVTIQGIYSGKEGYDSSAGTGKALDGMIATIKNAQGEMRTLRFEINATGNAFEYVSGEFNDKGVLKQVEQLSKFIDQYTSKLNSLRSQVGENFAPNITASLTQGTQQVNITFDSLLQKINALASGSGSVEEIRAEFVALESTVKSLNSVLDKSQNKGFNQFANAEISAREFQNTLAKIKSDIDNLNSANPEVAQLSNQFKYLSDSVKNLSKGNKDNAWIEQYAQISIKLREIKNEIKLVKQLESQDASSATRKQLDALHEIANAYKEIRTLTTKGETGSELKAEAEKQIAVQNEIINATLQRLQSEGLVTEDIQNQIQLYETELININALNQAKQRDVAIQKEESEALKQQKQIYSSLVQDVRTYTNALNNFNNAGAVKKNSGNSNISSQVAENTKLLTQLKTIFNELSQGFDNLPTDKLKDLEDKFNAIKDALKSAKDRSEEFKNSLASDKIDQDKANKIANLTNQINNYANANRKATESLKAMRNGTTFADEWERIVTTLQSGNLDNNAVQQLIQDFRNFKGEAESANLSVSKLFASMQSQLRLVLQRWVSLYAVVKYLRDMVDNVKSLDTAMINLKRVTEGTNTAYAKFIDNAEKQATALKTTTSALVEQSYQWAKLGYTMEESLELANASTIFMRVADVDQTQALSNLVTILKAYRIEAEDTIDVVDKLDKLNNEFAVSAAGLGEGLERSASSLQMTGNSLDQSLALLTGAGEITQNLENTGNALKVVALRLQGMKGKLEELEEPVDDLMEVSKIQTQILNLTKNQVNIYDGASDKFRSTYDILKDISEIWDTLSSTDRASLTEIMFGKLRANQGLAIIQAFQSGQIEAAYQASVNAAGTATKENEEMMEGLQAHMDAFKHSFEELSNAVMSSKFLKTLIDGGKTFLEILTKITKAFGSLTLVSTGVGIFAGFKNTNLFNVATMKQATAAFQTYNAQLTAGNRSLATRTILQNQENASLRSYIVSLNGAKASLGSYTSYLVKTKIETIALRAATVALNAVLTFGISAGISLLVTGINNLIHAEEKAAEEEANLLQTFEDNSHELEQTATSIDDLITKYSDLILNSKNLASAHEDLSKLQEQALKDYGSQATSIDLVNGKYSEQIQKLYDLKKAQAETFIYDKENIEAYKDAIDKLNNAGDGKGLSDFQFKLLDNKSRETFENFINQWKDDDLFVSFERMVGYGQQVSYGFELANKDALTVYETLDKMAESYKELSLQAGDFNEEQYTLIKQQAIAAKEYYDKYKAIKDYFEKQKEIAGIELSEETKKRYDDLITNIKDLYNQFGNTENLEDKFVIAQKLEEYKTKVYELISGNEELTTVTDNLFELIDDDLSTTLKSVDNLKQAWLKDYEEMEKGSLKTISTMVSALQDLSEGKGIASNTFWSLIEFDEEGFLNGAQLVGDKFIVQQEKLIALKDKYVQKQIDELRLKQLSNLEDKTAAETQMRILQTQIDMWDYSKKPLTNSVYNKEYEKLNSQLEKAKNTAKEYGEQWLRNKWLIDYLNESLGDTIDKQKQLEAQQKAINKELTALNKELDNYVKAHEKVIDSVIKKLEAEGDELEAQKKTLEDELDILNEQKDTLEDTIKNYESVNKLVQNTVKKEIDALKEQKEAIEDTYNKRIDALKSENEEREDALEYAQKLANLENAKKNKRRVYDETRGWRYESVKEDVAKAQNDLADFENNQAIKKLEKERDKETDAIDAIIKEKEAYSESWGDILDSIQTEEDELLAAEILGADWREKIAQGDTELMEKFRQEYQKHNTALQTLTKTEIKLKEEEIKAKDAEIDANKKRVESWKNYKNEVSTAVTEIKNANEEYMNQIGTIELNETSSLETRQQAFETFKDKVTGYVDEIAKKESELETIQNLQDGLGGDFDYNIHVEGEEELQKAAAAGAVLAATAGMTSVGAGIIGVGSAISIANNTMGRMADDIVGTVQDIMNRLGFASGGVADYTGLAMLHGRKNAPETIFNANDSAKLYEMVHNTPNLMADMIDKATKLSGFNLANPMSTSESTNVSFHIDKIVTDNPEDFAKQLDRYYQTKLTQNYVNN